MTRTTLTRVLDLAHKHLPSLVGAMIVGALGGAAAAGTYVAGLYAWRLFGRRLATGR